MKLLYKPDFERVQTVWDHFWEGELVDRPPLLAALKKAGREPVDLGSNRYRYAVEGRYAEQMDLIDAWLDGTEFLGEMVPSVAPDHGPDQFAAMLGSRLRFNEDSGRNTNWAEPIIDDWDEFLPVTLDERNETWQSLQRYSALLAEHSAGRYLVGGIDYHTHADALAALRHNDRFCLDLYDCPDVVETAMRQTRKLFPGVFERLLELSNMGGERGTIGAHPFWCRGRFTTIQCDFIALIGPEHFRRFILPAIEEEADYLDHSCFHLDGPAALVHLDDLLSVKGLDVIQWVSGAGQAPMHEWVEVLERIQQAGKAVWVYGVPVDAMKDLHRRLRADKVIYSVSVATREEFEAADRWLRKNC